MEQYVIEMPKVITRLWENYQKEEKGNLWNVFRLINQHRN